jgi:branched-chain amino acid transport system substrate-binding protein
MKLAGVVAVSATLALGASACGGKSDSGGGGGDTVTIGFMGDLTGENSGIVIPPKQAAQLAIDEYNATNPKVKITLKTYDSQGKGEQAVPLAKQAITKDKIAGLIGPAFSGESAQVDPVLEEGKVPSISASATNAALATHGWKYWHRLIANDNVQGAGIGNFIATQLKAKKVFIIHDSSEYGKPFAETVKSTVEKAGAKTSEDAIFFGGYYAQGGKLIKQLREGGVKARFLSGDGSLDKGLAAGAGGTTADGSIIGCPCLIDPNGTAGAASKKFATDYKAKFGADTAIYSAEGYDAATAFVQAVKAGNTTAEKINAYLSTIDIAGVSKQIKFGSNGEPTATDVYVYQVKGDQLPLLGNSKNATVK